MFYTITDVYISIDSVTFLGEVRPFYVHFLMGAAPRARKPCPQSSSTAFRADLRCASPLSASLSLRSKRWVIPLGLHLLPLPSPPVAQGLLVNNNRQYHKAERTTR